MDEVLIPNRVVTREELKRMYATHLPAEHRSPRGDYRRMAKRAGLNRKRKHRIRARRAAEHQVAHNAELRAALDETGDTL